jgi:FtsP/CotA-like multicopper oxidase with cupredoxin domain
VRTNAQEVLPGPTIAQQEVLLGPTIICDRGGIIDFELTNYLPAQDFNEASCHELHEKNLIEGSSEPGCFEEFSMHFHGLHVSPRSSDPNGSGIEFSSDHIFAPLVPYNGVDNPLGPDGKKLYTKRRFRLAIPGFHAPGTHWYHTHLHGSTAVQTSNGMAGAIIIPEPDDRKLGVNDEDDRIWLIQEFVPKIHDQDTNSDSDEEFYFKRTYTGSPANPNTGDESTVEFESPGRFLVNGQYVPTLNISAGCRQRWRFINATGTPRGPMQLKLYKLSESPDEVHSDPLFLDKLHSQLRAPETDLNLLGTQEAMYLIAVDGISFYGHNAQKVGPIGEELGSDYDDYREGWKLAPGNRADFLVSLAKGQYYLLKDSYDKQWEEKTGKTEKFEVKSDRRQVLGFINVRPNDDCTSTDSEDLSVVPIEGTLPNYLKPICNNELEDSPEDGVGSCNKPRIIDFAVRQISEDNDRRVGLYQINRKQFKDVPNEVAPIKVGLNTAERWLLRNIRCRPNDNFKVNEDGSFVLDDDGETVKYTYQGKSAPHPFHIHVNPFQVEGELIDPGIGDGPSNWRWRDVLAVDFEKYTDDNPVEESMCVGPDTDLGEFGENANDHYAQEEYEKHTKYKMIRNRFADFDGEYVVHCHILIHEDQGMMRKLIVGNAKYFNDYPDGAFQVEPGVVRHNECTDDDGSTDPDDTTCYTA